MFDAIKNGFLPRDKYRIHSEAVVISCFFNPQNSPYRLAAFKRFYEDIKHLNHRIIELAIGESPFQLEPTEFLTQTRTENLLWHKETLLNQIIANLPQKFKYVFWVDADVIFTNKNWLVDGVKELQHHNVIQPFEYCFHLDRDETEPRFSTTYSKAHVNDYVTNRRVWRSFAANNRTTSYSIDSNYDKHGHVGFAWGAQRWLLDEYPLYDRALIGGADHIIAHAAAGHIPHPCIRKSFTDDIEAVEEWSKNFHRYATGGIGYVPGDLYHIWHGDIEKRQYLKRIQEFTPVTKTITERDDNGFYTTAAAIPYVTDYFANREVSEPVLEEKGFGTFGGGDFGGAGAGSDWSADETKQEVKPEEQQNFS